MRRFLYRTESIITSTTRSRDPSMLLSDAASENTIIPGSNYAPSIHTLDDRLSQEFLESEELDSELMEETACPNITVTGWPLSGEYSSDLISSKSLETSRRLHQDGASSSIHSSPRQPEKNESDSQNDIGARWEQGGNKMKDLERVKNASDLLLPQTLERSVRLQEDAQQDHASARSRLARTGTWCQDPIFAHARLGTEAGVTIATRTEGTSSGQAPVAGPESSMCFSPESNTDGISSTSALHPSTTYIQPEAKLQHLLEVLDSSFSMSLHLEKERQAPSATMSTSQEIEGIVAGQPMRDTIAEVPKATTTEPTPPREQGDVITMPLDDLDRLTEYPTTGPAFPGSAQDQRGQCRESSSPEEQSKEIEFEYHCEGCKEV
jgi:hypothetical protein